MKKICIIAGEASGDLHGASLVEAIRQSDTPVSFLGLGGPLLQGLGVRMICPPPLNVVGFTEVVLKITHLFKTYQSVKAVLRTEKPDLIILIDYPDMNLRLAREAYKEKVPVLYYIGPQVWAWRSGRIKKIARYVNRLAVILPFEMEVYRSSGVQVQFVGHPLLDRMTGKGLEEPPPFPDSPEDQIRIGLLPGSRPSEIETILPVLLETASLLAQQYGPRLRFVLPVANTLDPVPIQEKMGPYQKKGVALELASEDSQKTLSRCHLALVASGTVTLEAAILGIPILIIYKVSPINYWIARTLIDVPYIGLVNWVAGKKIIPEYIQSEAVPEAILEGCRRYLEDPVYYQHIRQELIGVRNKLGGPGASRRVAQMALEMMNP